MSWFAPELEPLLAVAVAALDARGTLIEANAGFLKLIDAVVSQPIGVNVARTFIQPDFATLLRARAGSDGEIYRGLMTIGDYMGRSRSLHGRVWQVDGRLRVLAEYDIEELERLNDTVLELNLEYANAQADLAQVNLKLRQREAQILASSLTDPLTGVGNRRRLEQALAEEVSRAERTGGKLCGFIADLDHFKRVNDTYGHESGDKVLAAFGELLRRGTRATDVVARFGGEEFVVLMPDTCLADGVAIAERIRAAMAACRIEPLPTPVTASFGVAALVAGERGSALLRRADSALYGAKHTGRNRVATGSSEAIPG
jgi:two-component system, cell cycle response regulator